MGMEIALIPAAMFIMGIGMMIYMKKKRGSLAPGYAQQEMKRFVKEMVPQLSEEEFHVIDCPWNAEHHFVIAYTDESIFLYPGPSQSYDDENYEVQRGTWSRTGQSGQPYYSWQ